MKKGKWSFFTKTHCLVLANDAARLLDNLPESDENTLNNIAVRYKEQHKTSFVTKENLQQIIDGLVFKAVERTDCLLILDYFKNKSFSFRTTDKALDSTPEKKTSFAGDGATSNGVLLQRYFLLREMAQDTVAKKRIGNSLSLIAEAHGGAEVFLFGLLKQIGNTFYLEDEKDTIQVCIEPETVFSGPGVFVPNTFVAVRGSREETVFRAREFQNIEVDSLKKTIDKYDKETPETQPLSEDEHVLFVSGVFLDCNTAIARFEEILSAAEETGSIPYAIFMFGPFLGSEEEDKYSKLKHCLGLFLKRIETYPAVTKKTKIVLIPAGEDPFETALLPRLPIPSPLYETKNMKQSPVCIFSVSNPLKIVLFGRNITLFTKKCFKKVVEKDISRRTETSIRSVFESIIGQFFLSIGDERDSFLLNHTDGLALYPVPEVVVFCDDNTQFYGNVSDVFCLCPGKFSMPDYPYFSLSFKEFKIRKHGLR
ncbi:MAG: DNA polymerase epsilon subunit B [Amphiamblys sp. WSBS2006]|nr:MAG: DNA polymerase epsilon subunit B [Amphiamblys sp. WSBS2006]